MRILITILCLLTSFYLSAQLVGDPRIKYHVEVDGVDWDVNAGGTDGDPEGRWKVRSQTSPYSSNSCDPDDYTSAICIERDSYSAITGLQRQLRASNNAAYSTYVYYNVLAFEKDGDTNCNYDSNDDYKHCGRGTIKFNNHPVNTFYTYSWHNIQLKNYSDIRMRQIWSYRDGQWGQTAELKFGELQSGTTYQHNNSTVLRSYSGQTFGYTSSFNVSGGTVPGIQAQDANDVVYGFSIADDQKKVTINTPSANFDHYIYLIRDNGGSSFTLLGADGGDLTPEVVADLCPGNYLIVVEGKDGLFVSSQGTFQLQVHAASPTTTAGEISLPKPFVKQGCQLTLPIESAVDATTSFGSIEYAWEKRTNSTQPWEAVENATNSNLTGNELGDLSEDVEVRRSANVNCSEQKIYSNIISIDAVTNTEIGGNGVIQGKITGPNGQGAVNGAVVYAISDAPGECIGHIDSTFTNEVGSYTLGNLYYGANGENTNFKVFPRFLDHGFEPDTINVVITTNAPVTDIDFKDTTAVFIEGRLFQVDENQDTCGIADNSLFLNGMNQVLAPTGVNGNYNLVIQQRTSNNLYNVRPDTTDYFFNPEIIENIFAIEDVSGINFENTRRDTIRGAVTACGGTYFGSVKLRIEDTWGSCFTYFVDTDINGEFKIAVPAREYIVAIEGVNSTISPYTSGEILTYFEDIIDTVDVTKEEATVSFIYRQPPSISITGLPTNICNDNTDTVFYQGVPVPIIFNITEINTGGCPLDTGVLIINDDISDIAGNIEIPISKGRADYTIVPGEPFIFGDYKKSFTVLARDIERPDNVTQVDFKAIVDGNKPRESTFTTVSPNIPLLILRDPPGDRSFSTYSKDTSTQIVTSFSKQIGGGLSTWSKVKAGTKNGAGIGFTTEFEANVNREKEFSINGKNVTQDEMTTEITANITYNTSNEDDGIGAEADLFVGGAFNIRYALTDLIIYDTETCVVDTATDIIMGLDSLVTEFTAAAKDIENTIIAGLEELADIGDDVAKRRFNNQVNLWQQMLDRRDALNLMAIDETENPVNRTITGTAGPLSYASSSGSSNSTFYELLLEVERSVAVGAKLEVAGAGVEGKVQVNFRFEAGKSGTTVTSSKTTVGYTLDDDDSPDFYEVQVYEDPVYQTPVFVSESPTTSCPYTGGRKVDNPVLTVTPAIRSNVPANGQAEYTFTVTNGTELPPTSDYAVRSYVLDIDNASNPHGAVIVVGGDGNFPLEFDNIGKGASLNRDLAVTRIGAPNQSIYTYEGLEFELQPVCESLNDSLFTESTREISAYFTSECSGITLASPAPGWEYSSASASVLSILLTEYDKTKLSTVTLQYSEKGINQWTDDVVLTASQLNDDSTQGEDMDWTVPPGLEGEYEIRLKLNCTNGVVYSQRSAGLIDRTPPMLYGLPAPIDDVYDISQNDEISISYTEDIACANVNTQLLDALTDDPIPHTTSCSVNTLQIVPNSGLASSAYRVIVNGVEDDYQNTAQEYRWIFITEGFVYDPGCTPIVISNNNLNQDAISQSVYRSLQITSDGTVADGTTIDYRAEQTVDLSPGFTVSAGGALEANIENCNED